MDDEIIDGEFEQEESEETIEDIEDETLVVTIGDEEPEEEQTAAPQWVKELRQKNREDQRKIRELEAKLKEKEEPQKPVLGKKPTLEGFDYDSDKYETALEEWYEQKRAVEAEEAEAKNSQERQQQQWQEKLSAYEKKKGELKVSDYEDAESVILDSLNQTQQGIIVQGSDNPALVIYALGKNSKKVKELAEIKDPVQFAFAIAKLETQLKVSGRKSPPPPEKTISGTAKSSGAIDSTLERLRKEAEKTGDFSKVHEYKRQKRQRA